ncbi:hypothetical protein HA49_13780 [Tatumella morbirosei]|uniref:Uncharacterized protein n=1 Tax=Tatumella morbirosei TaxID=642227 RepID=A0A095VB08_9GAMM|nr:hypothetical protein HA49_13780 [Tatumella morbirosei]
MGKHHGGIKFARTILLSCLKTLKQNESIHRFVDGRIYFSEWLFFQGQPLIRSQMGYFLLKK